MKKIILATTAIFCIALVGYYASKKQVNDKFKVYDFPSSPPFEMPEFEELELPEKVCNITDFGAKNDGITMNTRAFTEAISECAKDGGGHVHIPKGIWLTGAIHLQSNIDLHLEEGATILFSGNPADYLPAVFTRFEGIELMNYSPFIYAKDCENISISGTGTLNGQGEKWMKWKDIQKGDAQRLYKMAEDGTPLEERIFTKEGSALRPSFVEFVNCRNVQLSDFTLINSPMWAIHPLYSENVLIQGIKMNITGHNTDGIAVDSSKYVLIDNVDLETGDDSISIKSGLDKDGWRVNRPSESIVIANSKMKKGHSSITIGSEMSGSVKNVYVHDCVFENSDQGIRVKSMKGRGGFVENFWIRDMAMSDINNAVVQLDMQYESSTNDASQSVLPKIKNIYLKNIVVTGKKAKHVLRAEGLSESRIENIHMSSVKSQSEQGISINEADGIYLDQIDISAKKNPIFRFINAGDFHIQNSVCKQEEKNCASLILRKNLEE